MFVHWYDDCVRLTGRWSRLREAPTDPHDYVHPGIAAATAGAPGSYFELAFTGTMAMLQFDLGYRPQPVPHLWISGDGGARVEVPVDQYLRVEASTPGNHVVKVIYKGGMEHQHRWHLPLFGCVSFVGAQVEAPGILPEDNRRIIEFIGDSITEGVLIDVDYDTTPANGVEQHNRRYQDDNCATYAALTADALNLRPMFQAYGAVGLTRSGCGGVPRAGLLYPWVFERTPYTGEKPDIVMINHGANDRNNGAEEYIQRYEEFIDMVNEINPDAIIVCLGAFCGAYDDDLRAFAERYNASHEKPIHFISSKGWVPLEPLHPMRDGHRTIADHLIPLLKEIIG